MSALAVPNPPVKRGIIVLSGISVYTPQDETTWGLGTRVYLYDTAGLCLSVPETGILNIEGFGEIYVVKAPDGSEAVISEMPPVEG